MKNNKKGFTLIELMIVVAITGILGAIAIPLYKAYVIRAQVSEGLNLSASAKEAVSDYYMNHGSWPANNEAAGMVDKDDIKGEYTDGVKILDNTIEIQFGYDARAEIFGEKVILTARDESGSVTWTCASQGAIEAKFLPQACQ